jgi:hypothetical protein
MRSGGETMISETLKPHCASCDGLTERIAELEAALREIADSGEFEADPRMDHDVAHDHNRLVRIASAALKDNP